MGDMPEIAGGGRNVKVPNETPVPTAVVTLRFTAPTPAGDTAVIWVAEFTTKLAAAVLPNVHRGRARESGAGDDDAGATALRAGRRDEARDVRRGHVAVGADDVPVPFAVVTLTVTAPAPAGLTAVICVAELTV